MNEESDIIKTRVRKSGFTKKQALQKLRHFCGYQERSHEEAAQKLWNLGMKKADQDEIISLLIEEGYLNEERFAIQFAGGKFRINGWGRKKIIYALKEKKVSIYCIKKALKSISETDYKRKLKDLAYKKYQGLKNEKELMRKKKTIDYLLQKGYEHQLIMETLMP